MQEGVTSFLSRYTRLSAFGIVLLLILIVNLVATPLLNSGDDAFLMYTLAGGYGEPPSHLLHYNHIWHPWLGFFIKKLFIAYPEMNWYSLLLVFVHLSGCTAVLYIFLKKLKPAQAVLFFLVLFCFIEVRLLLSLTFTGSALVAAAGALSLLIFQFTQKQQDKAITLFAISLLLLAGLLRPQIVWLTAFLLLPAAFILLSKYRILIFGFLITGVIGLLFLLNIIHRNYYREHIPGWDKQENFRQALFNAYNRPVKPAHQMGPIDDSTTLQLFFAAFLYDSSVFTPGKISNISKQITGQRRLTEKKDREALYWFFIEMRIYILLFAIMIILLLVQKKYRPARNWLFSFAAFTAVHGYLFIYMKITPPLHLGMLFVLWISLILQLSPQQPVFPGNKKTVLIASVLLVFLFSWMGIRVFRENETNKARHQRFLCSVESINLHTDKLFVATYDIFPLDYFYVWNVPGKFPVTNLLYKDRLLTHTYPATLQRFGITDFNEALHTNKNIYLLGPPLPALLKKERGESLTDKLPGFGCLEVRQMIRPE